MKKAYALIAGWLCFLSLKEYAEEAATPPPVEQEQTEEKLLAAVENLGPSAAGFSSVGDFGPEDDENLDNRVLRDFVESRGLIQCRQKEGSLTIAGDVRARWNVTGETLRGIKQRGQGTLTALHRFRSEINLMLDYVAARAWVSTKLKFVNFDGIDGGSATRVEMERAFIGYDVFSEGEEDFYIELGRSKLDYMFDSRVEFSSFFDGIHVYYTRCWPTVGQFTIHGGPFIVDSRTNHYAWIVETFITGWRGTGLSFKYSIVDWHRGAFTTDYGNREGAGKLFVRNNPRYRFLVSQMLIGYEKKIDFLGCKTFFLYGAVLANHLAKPTFQTGWEKANRAWYTGFTLGKLCKACDWSIDINYQYVEAATIPEFDLIGIGHGNAANGLLSDAILSELAPNDLTLFTNYQGLQAVALYALTDSLSLRAKAEFSVPCNPDIGGPFRYKNFEMTAIYAF